MKRKQHFVEMTALVYMKRGGNWSKIKKAKVEYKNKTRKRKILYR